MARRKASDEMRESFIVAALNLCRAGGPQAVSARRLGRLLGLSQMAVYRHFEDMEDLLVHAWDRAYQELLDHVEGVLSGDDPMTDLKQGLRAYVRFGVENPGLYRLMFFHHFERMELLQNQRTGLQALDLLKRTLERWLVQDHALSISQDELHCMALQAWFTVHGLTTMAITGRFQRISQDVPEDVAGHIIDHVCADLLAQGQAGS